MLSELAKAWVAEGPVCILAPLYRHAYLGEDATEIVESQIQFDGTFGQPDPSLPLAHWRRDRSNTIVGRSFLPPSTADVPLPPDAPAAATLYADFEHDWLSFDEGFRYLAVIQAHLRDQDEGDISFEDAKKVLAPYHGDRMGNQTFVTFRTFDYNALYASTWPAVLACAIILRGANRMASQTAEDNRRFAASLVDVHSGGFDSALRGAMKHVELWETKFTSAERAELFTGIAKLIQMGTKQVAPLRALSRTWELPLAILRHMEQSGDSDLPFHTSPTAAAYHRAWRAWVDSVWQIEMWLVLASLVHWLLGRLKRSERPYKAMHVERCRQICNAWGAREGACREAAAALPLLRRAEQRLTLCIRLADREIKRLAPISETPAGEHIRRWVDEGRRRAEALLPTAISMREEAEQEFVGERSRALASSLAAVMDAFGEPEAALQESVRLYVDWFASGEGEEPAGWDAVESAAAGVADSIVAWNAIEAEFRSLKRGEGDTLVLVANLRSRAADLARHAAVASELRLSFSSAVMLEEFVASKLQEADAMIEVLRTAIDAGRSTRGIDLASMAPEVEASIRYVDAVGKGGFPELSLAQAPPIASAIHAVKEGLRGAMPTLSRLVNPPMPNHFAKVSEASRAVSERVQSFLANPLAALAGESPPTESAPPPTENSPRAIELAVLRYLAPTVARSRSTSDDVRMAWGRCVHLVFGQGGGLAGATIAPAVEVENALGLTPLPAVLLALAEPAASSRTPQQQAGSASSESGGASIRCERLEAIVLRIAEVHTRLHQVAADYKSVPKRNKIRGMLGKAKSLFGRGDS
jgi:hypothetical protein